MSEEAGLRYIGLTPPSPQGIALRSVGQRDVEIPAWGRKSLVYFPPPPGPILGYHWSSSFSSARAAQAWYQVKYGAQGALVTLQDDVGQIYLLMDHRWVTVFRIGRSLLLRYATTDDNNPWR